MNEDLVIEVTRLGVKSDTGHVFGTMVVKSNGTEIGKFTTLERGVRFTNLKIGTYEMHHSEKRKGRKVPCLRPTNLYISSVLIHDALRDDANELEGCIAPFMDTNYKQSAKAMTELFNLLGGYDKSHKKKVTLKILSNVPGELRTAEQWIAQRKKKWQKNTQRQVTQ
jgi:hypothetical protein